MAVRVSSSDCLAGRFAKIDCAEQSERLLEFEFYFGNRAFALETARFLLILQDQFVLVITEHYNTVRTNNRIGHQHKLCCCVTQ